MAWARSERVPGPNRARASSHAQRAAAQPVSAFPRRRRSPPLRSGGEQPGARELNGVAGAFARPARWRTCANGSAPSPRTHADVVLYERLGTKGLVLRNGKPLREINRSFYHAHDYEYPVCLFRAESGRTLVAHCPEDYKQIEIDDAETGERVTGNASDRKPTDFFHSRLQANPSGSRLLSAGWVWHPQDAVVWFDVQSALEDPGHLDSLDQSSRHSRNVGLAEESSACWQTVDRILLGSSAEEEDEEEAAEAGNDPRLEPSGLAIYDVVDQRCVRSIPLETVPGTMMPVGENHVVTFYEHPRLIRLTDGSVEQEWRVPSGTQTSSILMRDSQRPPLALESRRGRFAVAADDEIVVVELDMEKLIGG